MLVGGDDKRADALATVSIVAIKLGAMVLVTAMGFSHVSDDDYSRTVIAQTFAHSPKLDPSGTSWLPFPFWLTGGAMMVAGRSLMTARVVAWLLGVLGALGPYWTLRYLQSTRLLSWFAAVVCAVLPWSVWLSAATVPEGWTGPAVACALLLATSEHRRAWLISASLAIAASLSRYEAWPACAVLAVTFLWRARTNVSLDRRALLIACVVAAVGPFAWMAWNGYAHGDPLHFFVRVSTFRQNSGNAPRSTGARVLEYPFALVVHFPLVVFCLVLALSARERRRLILPLAGAGAILAFLVAGDVSDGAPTHHPERALGAIATLLIALAVSRLSMFPPRALRGALAGLALATIFSLVGAEPTPGAGDSERREAQIARGRALSTDPNLKLIVTPCQYEHFALIAATGTPERFDIDPITRSPVTDECPRLRAP